MEDENSMDVDGDRVDAEMASDSEEDNSSDDERKEEELTKKKQTLQSRIEEDKTDYAAYEELIQVLSSLGDLDDLRNVREKLSTECPLSPQSWLAWIEDEKKIITSAEEKRSLNLLFERALKDFPTIDIWQEYVMFNIGLTAEGNAIENVRGILERAVETCGYNVASGSLLWDLYREFEETVLASMSKSNQSNEEFEIAITAQKQKIANVFYRQLSLPLLDMEKTYEELQKWIETANASGIIDIESLERNYKKALDKLSRVLDYENALASAPISTTLPIYEKYLEYEKNPKDGGNELRRVICLYERAVTDNPSNADLWSDYLNHVSKSKIVPEDQEAICYRALRNCRTEVKFWYRYLRFLERRSVVKSEITEFFNKALQIPFPTAADYRSLWFGYIYYLRRQLDLLSKDDNKWEVSVDEIRNIITMAYQNLTECFGLDGDPECKLSLWWARFEAEVVHNYKQFRDIWTDIMDAGHGKTSSYWIRYIMMEWQFGDSKHMRRLCQRALSNITDNPKAITTLWLEYESMNGSLDSYSNCEIICEERLKKFALEKKANEKHDDKKQKKTPKADKPKEKTKIIPKEETKKSVDTVDGPQKQKLEGKWSKLSVEKPRKETMTTETSRTHVTHDPSKDDRTVFVSNLDYTVSEEEVKKLLGAVGQIEEFRLVRDFKGRSKGYGYCVFPSKKEVQEALKFDRTPINKRPMFVSECDPDKQSRKTGLRFTTGLEKNKLFVKGLPKTMTKEDVEKMFSPHGALKNVRLVTLRNGHSKGLAYVEYEDEASATHALVRTDQTEVDGKIITVAISNPPERKNTASLLSDRGEPLANFALGGGSTDKTDFGSRGRGRTQLSFVPASILKSTKPSSVESDAMEVSESPPNTSKPKATNEDFRNLLFGKK